MQAIGIAIVALGLIGLIYGIFQKVKAGRLMDAPLASTGDVAQKGKGVAGPKGQISAQGNVGCPQPLVSPVTGTQCLFYSIKCTAEWKDGETKKSKTLDEQKVAAQFSIDDGTGAVWIDAREGGDFEPSQKKSETKSTGLIGGITGTELVFGNYRVQTGALALGTKYTVEEEILPLSPRVYACGVVAEQGNAITAPRWRSLILSSKSRDDLLASASKGAKIFLAGGAAAFLLGSGLAIAGQMTAGDKESKVAAVASVAQKESPPRASAGPSNPAATTAAPSAAAAPAATTKSPASIKKPTTPTTPKAATTAKK